MSFVWDGGAWGALAACNRDVSYTFHRVMMSFVWDGGAWGALAACNRDVSYTFHRNDHVRSIFSNDQALGEVFNQWVRSCAQLLLFRATVCFQSERARKPGDH
jgi:hypothetical protein